MVGLLVPYILYVLRLFRSLGLTVPATLHRFINYYLYSTIPIQISCTYTTSIWSTCTYLFLHSVSFSPIITSRSEMSFPLETPKLIGESSLSVDISAMVQRLFSVRRINKQESVSCFKLFSSLLIYFTFFRLPHFINPSPIPGGRRTNFNKVLI